MRHHSAPAGGGGAGSDETERLAVTLRSIGDGVIATDTASRVTLINPVAERLTGWARAEAAGRGVGEVLRLVHEVTREPLPNPARQALTTGQTVALANHAAVISRSGNEPWVADSAAPIRDEGGRVLGIVRKHSGHIAAESTPGTGTTLSVHLPAIPGGVSAGKPSPTERRESTGRGWREVW